MLMVVVVVGCGPLSSLGDPVAMSYGGCRLREVYEDPVGVTFAQTVQYDEHGDIVTLDGVAGDDEWFEEHRYGAPHEVAHVVRDELGTVTEWESTWVDGDVVEKRRSVDGVVEWIRVSTWQDHRAVRHEDDEDGDGTVDVVWTFTWTDAGSTWEVAGTTDEEDRRESARYDKELRLLWQESVDGVTVFVDEYAGYTAAGDAATRHAEHRLGDKLATWDWTNEFDGLGRRLRQTGVGGIEIDGAWVTTGLEGAYTYTGCAW